MEKFTIGLLIGGMVGALCVANNYKMRALIKKGQQEVQNKVDELLDEKLACFGDEEDDEAQGTQKSKKSRAKKATE